LNTPRISTLRTKSLQDKPARGDSPGGCLGGLIWAMLFELAGLLTIVLLVVAWRALHL
jgi:hypothetical protein